MSLDLTDPSVGFDAETGSLKTGWPHVIQSLRDIFDTQFGTRIMREWYGSFVPNLLGRLITPQEVVPYFAAITSAIEQWEPRFRVTRSRSSRSRGTGSCTSTSTVSIGRARCTATSRQQVPGGSTPMRTPTACSSTRGSAHEPLHRDRSVRPPPPDIIATLDYEAIVKDMRDDLVTRFPLIAGVIDLESEPARKLIEAFAYRELGLRARINDAAKAVLLASSYGTNLDHLGALFATERQDDESDARFRRRIQLAPEAFSVAGPAGAYQYHALTAAPWARDASRRFPRGLASSASRS
ncbi:MAG: baseplate J/gp47 family protein [Hyphomicrobiaceae bacterium]